VRNTPRGVQVEVEGVPRQLNHFLERVERDKPAHAQIQHLDGLIREPAGYTTFEIRPSLVGGAKAALVLPDYATCADCLRDITDPANRRYRYAFTNCTHCGPRFSIIDALPYDRPNTTMRGFAMCEACLKEYQDPLDRRFHAQPNACPRCGPRLELWDERGHTCATGNEAILQTAAYLRAGGTVAIKGLGGFQLLVDARSPDAVNALRRQKRREEKPFAIMCPSSPVVKAVAHVSALEEELLCSPEAPIVLLRRLSRPAPAIAGSVAPGNPYLGVMLPYTPLHHLLLGELGFPVVATSGNLSEEPICTDEREALERLAGLAGLFLVHNRPIARHVDDSVIRVVQDRELVLRRARGYAPLPVSLARPVPPLLAVGAHLKNAIAVAVEAEVFVSQHIGDLETTQAYEAFRQVNTSLQQLYDLRPVAVACDLHPDYLSTQHARKTRLPVVPVQHHYAHVLACMAENHLTGPLLGVSWDGTGYGPDHTVWGGEFLRVTETGYERVAHLRTFPLPGGDLAVKEPRRTALGLLYELYGDALCDLTELPPVQAFAAAELSVLRTMLAKGVNTPRTSSAGRLFDALAAILGLRQRCHFEGQAALELEFALDGVKTDEHYPVGVHAGAREAYDRALTVDWAGLVLGVLEDARRGVPRDRVAAKCHNTMVEAMVAVARRVGEEHIVLTGGCFQNKYLTERAIQRLRFEGLEVHWHRQIPPNDGGIAVGQILAAARSQNQGHEA
jgi:hydrogenase maturation protein HypF